MALPCDLCSKPAVVLVSHIDTGEQPAYCAEHFQHPTGAGAPATPAGVCELCETEPAVVMQQALADGSKLLLCSGCMHLTARMGWEQLPADTREQIERLISGEPDTPGRSRRRKRGAEADASPLRVVPENGVSDDPAGLGDGLAVDGASAPSPADAQAERAAEVDPRDALEPSSVLDHHDAGVGL